MNLLIVTGMSGAGKSQAANVLEDMGFYCVDNIPPAIIPSFVELSKRGNEELGRIAIVTDARGGDMFNDISDVLASLSNSNVNYKILFLDASDDVLVHRYKENRRKHPHKQKLHIIIAKQFINGCNNIIYFRLIKFRLQYCSKFRSNSNSCQKAL